MADRPQGRRRPRHLHRRHRGPAHPQLPRGTPGRNRADVAADDETAINTGEKLTRAAGQEKTDEAVAAEFVAAETAPAGTGGGDSDHDGARGQRTWYAASARGTGDRRAAIAGAGHRAVITPWPPLPAVDGGFTAVTHRDVAAGTVTCTAGVTWHVTARTPSSAGPPAGTPTARTEHHRQCRPRRAPNEHDDLLRPARAGWAAAGPGHRTRHPGALTVPEEPHTMGPMPHGPARTRTATRPRPGRHGRPTRHRVTAAVGSCPGRHLGESSPERNRTHAASMS